MNSTFYYGKKPSHFVPSDEPIRDNVTIFVVSGTVDTFVRDTFRFCFARLNLFSYIQSNLVTPRLYRAVEE